MGARRGGAAVAASSEWRGDDGIRQPAGDLHAWQPGTNQTLCGLALSRSRLLRFPHVPWGRLAAPDAAPPAAPGAAPGAAPDADAGDGAGPVGEACRRCRAATGHVRQGRRPWTRDLPRP
jgi:hypothetical protein